MEISVEDQIYICKYIEKIGLSQVQKDLKKYGKSQIEEFVKVARSNGIYSQYKNMSEGEYEKAIANKPKVGRPKKVETKEIKTEGESKSLLKYYEGKITAYQEIIRMLIEGRNV